MDCRFAYFLKTCACFASSLLKTSMGLLDSVKNVFAGKSELQWLVNFPNLLTQTPLHSEPSDDENKSVGFS